MRHRYLPAVALVATGTIVACAGHLRPAPPVLPDDTQPVAEPAPTTVSILADGFHQQIAAPLRRSLDLARHVRALSGRRREAYNANALDEVDDSAWFVNRNHLQPLTPAQVAVGPNTNDGPDTAGTLRVSSAKVEGVTPGFTIKDSRGDRYVIKLDAPGHRELNSAAEIVSTKLLYTAGYHVPENHVTWFDPTRLELADRVRFTDAEGTQRDMMRADLDELLAHVEIGSDGRVRAVASRFLRGKSLGPFRYEGVRPDDANDRMPHQHRRELRGLRVVAAWLNHYDTKANNSLDVYVADGYVRHYLLDFGSTLGSQGDEPMPVWVGHENEMDVGQMVVNAATLGLWPRPWERAAPMRSPAVGYFEADLFDPGRYESIFPNPAFEQLTDRDGFWGARLVMSFSDAQIDAAVAAGRYCDPADAAYVADVLRKRRDLIGRHWFGRVNPLDRFLADADRLSFVDLAVATGLAAGQDASYRARIHTAATPPSGPWRALLRATPSAAASVDLDGLPPGRHCVGLQTRRLGHGWMKEVRVVVEGAPGNWRVVQIGR